MRLLDCTRRGFRFSFGIIRAYHCSGAIVYLTLAQEQLRKAKEAEIARKAEEERKKKAEAEARKAEEIRKAKAEDDARRAAALKAKAEDDAKRAEAARRQQAIDEARRAEEAKQRKAEEARRKKEEAQQQPQTDPQQEGDGPPAGWIKHDLGDLTIYIPPQWKTMPGDIPDNQGGWYVGTSAQKPDVAFAVLRGKDVVELLNSFNVTSKRTVTVGGRTATEYRGKSPTEDSVGKGVTITTGTSDGQGILFLSGTPSALWQQYAGVIDQILGSVHFKGDSTPHATKPKERPKSQSGPRQVKATLVNNAGQNVHIFAAGDTFGPQNRLTPGQSRTITITINPGSRVAFYSGRGGVVIDTKAWSPDNGGRPKVVFGANEKLTITTVP